MSSFPPAGVRETLGTIIIGGKTWNRATRYIGENSTVRILWKCIPKNYVLIPLFLSDKRALHHSRTLNQAISFLSVTNSSLRDHFVNIIISFHCIFYTVWYAEDDSWPWKNIMKLHLGSNNLISHLTSRFAASNPYYAPPFWKHRSNTKSCRSLHGFSSVWTTGQHWKYLLFFYRFALYKCFPYTCPIWNWRYSTTIRLTHTHLETQAFVKRSFYPCPFFQVGLFSDSFLTCVRLGDTLHWF